MLGIDDKTMRQIAAMPTEHSWLAPMILESSDLEELESSLNKWLKKKIFPGEPEELEGALYQAWRIVRDMYPLLLENEAIAEFVSQNPQWMGYLPEVNTAWEAAQLGAMDQMYVHPKVIEFAEDKLEQLQQGALKPDAKL